MQIAGKGVHLPADRLREAIAKSVTLHQIMLRFVHAFLTQTSQTALANGRSRIEERLARWLLMAQDRVDGNELKLTHEFLAVMLGVRRSGITTALQELERKGLIAHRRSFVTVLDREGLEESSNGTYSPPPLSYIELSISDQLRNCQESEVFGSFCVWEAKAKDAAGFQRSGVVPGFGLPVILGLGQ